MSAEADPTPETTSPSTDPAPPDAEVAIAMEPKEPVDAPLGSIDVSMPEEGSSVAAPVAFQELESGSRGGGNALELLLDVGVEVAAVVGTRELKLEQIMALQPGALIELDKHAGQPIELYVNGKPIALAEIVVIDGRLGARVIESLAPRK